MKKYFCKVCKATFEVADGVEPVCPKCKATGDKLEEIVAANPYAGTQTEKNLEAAFAGESQARNKYTYFASKAKKEGFEQIAALFLTMVGTLLPAVSFSGLMNPVAALEGLGRFIGEIYPSTYMFIISRGVFSKALGMSDLNHYFWPMIIAIPVILSLAVLMLKKQET